MIHGQNDEAVRKWDEYKQHNRPASQPIRPLHRTEAPDVAV
jgi:hypothetical protein